MKYFLLVLLLLNGCASVLPHRAEWEVRAFKQGEHSRPHCPGQHVMMITVEPNTVFFLECFGHE